MDWHNLYAPKNAGSQNFFYYVPWPEFDKPVGNPGFEYDSNQSMLIEYRTDPNTKASASISNGFTYHAAILSSALPRFRVYTRGDDPTSPNSVIGLVYGCTQPGKYPNAQGPLTNFTGKYGDNSRYFMIFDYVKRKSTIVSPYLGTDIQGGYDMQFINPIILPDLENIPEGTGLDLSFQTTANPYIPGSQSGWVQPGEVMGFNVNMAYKNYNYIRFKALFTANVDAGVVPSIDSIVIPYLIVED